MADKQKIYTIATAHLDTSWLWTLEQSINEYIPDTLNRNFDFFRKYPEYRFNFEGSYRYELIKEYYPEEYKLLKKYISEGRWHTCGACYENGDVNIPSPEALTRNILYGKDFFRKEFNVESEDIFLPDCFGFGRALPTVAVHSGVKGFSTGKLFWGCWTDVPFDTGIWKGIDSNGIWSCLKPFSYTTAFGNIKKEKRLKEKLNENKKNGLPSFTFAYHGIGDRGGAPHKSSVKNVIKAQRSNETSETQVYSATTKEYFDMLDSLPEETKNKMPVYEGEFLLTAHGTGSYTSRTVTKRWNRRCEELAAAAEKFSSAAYSIGIAPYPLRNLDDAWKKVISHHFHDDITGTSFEECYLRSHNDYVQAMNTFSEEYTAAVKALAGQTDTSFCKGMPVIVSNPVDSVNSRKEAVKVVTESKSRHFNVYDKNGSLLPCQTKVLSENSVEVTFLAEVKSIGIAAYDIREAESENSFNTGISVSDSALENKYIKVRLDSKGDICSIFDKTLQKELLSAPVRFQILNNVNSFDWPSWEIKYEDCMSIPYMYPHSPTITIRDNGPVLASIEITRHAGNSVFTQLISLDCESPYVRVYNETDWREEASLLKASFSLSAENDFASYDTGLGGTLRATNTEKLYEVPAQKWVSLTDKSGDFGVGILSDSRQGWDKPSESELRLTLIHTPMSNYRWECSQHLSDMGINRYSFAITGLSGDNSGLPVLSDSFCQPMHTFITDKHKGSIQEDFSFVKLSSENVRISAIKKAQNSDKIIFRVSEQTGCDHKNTEARFFIPVKEAWEVRGDETEISRIPLQDGRLCFDIGHNSIKSFAVSFDKASSFEKAKEIDLEFNATGITKDKETATSTLKNGISIPYELVPDSILCAGVNYSFSKESKNCISCNGSVIKADTEYDTLHLLITSLEGDKDVTFLSGDKKIRVHIPDCNEPLGHWDLMRLRKTAYIKATPQALSFSHTHSQKGNITGRQFYVFHAELPIEASGEIKLPDDSSIIIFAASMTKNDFLFRKNSQHSDFIEERSFDYTFSPYAKKLMTPNKAEIFLDRFIDRSYSMRIKADGFYNKYSVGEIYFILRNLNNKRKYKDNVKKLIAGRKQT